MRKILLVFLLGLAGCAAVPQPQPQPRQAVSACAVSEASYACQVERYHNVNVP